MMAEPHSDIMKPKRQTPETHHTPAPTSQANESPKRPRTAQDVRRDNLRTDIGGSDPKILGR
jgi:hypothetical protein